MSDFIGDWHALAVLLLAGVIPNQIWRLLGLWLGAGLDEGSDLLMWVKAGGRETIARSRVWLGHGIGRYHGDTKAPSRRTSDLGAGAVGRCKASQGG